MVSKAVMAGCVLISAAIARGEVFTWECDSFPVAGGWGLLQQFCVPILWVEDGQYIQQLDMVECPGKEQGGHDSYRRTLDDFVGGPSFFLEWKVEANGDASEIVAGAPTAMAVGNSFGIRYTFFVARDRAKLNRDNLLPIVFADFEAGVPHVHRLELVNGPINLFWWYIDGELVTNGIAEGAFPSNGPRITWRGKSWQMPAFNRWDCIRYGDIAVDGSGDFDSADGVGLRDWRYFEECSRNSGISIDAGPGCRWADMDGDGDVDLVDFAGFQGVFGG